MDLQHEVVLSYIEEDNEQNGYFRAFPLLSVSGDVRQEARVSWPDEGALRIIPDRAEHFTFKDRMRGLDSWCILDLTAFDPGASKIRTNKNYHPDRGEINRFIVFSDAVQAVGPAPFFEVLDGKPDAAPELARASITPRFLIREGDTWYGPVSREEPAVPGTASDIDASMFRMEAPDGSAHLILCSDEPARLPIGKSLEILDQSKTFEETIAALSQPLSEKANLISDRRAAERTFAAPDDSARRLTGTPLIRTSVRTSEPTLRNRVQEVVSGRAVTARNAEPPAPPVPFSRDLPTVSNPVKAAESAFAEAWKDTAARPALARFVLSLEGMKPALDAAVGGDRTSVLATAMQHHLENLEIERLRLLIDLDHAKRDFAEFRAKAIAEASQKARRELDALQRERGELAGIVDRLRNEANELLGQARAAGVRVGVSASGKEILQRVEAAFGAEALPYHRERAAVWLALMSRPGAVGFVSPDAEATASFIESHAALLGWPCTTVGTGSPLEGLREATPVLRLSLDADTVCGPEERVLIAVPDAGVLAASDMPIMPVSNTAFRVPEDYGSPLVSAASMQAILSEAPIDPEKARAVLAPVFEAAGLGEEILSRAASFTAVAAGLLEGGPLAASDWAVVLWLIPRLTAENREAVLPLLEEYPRARALAG